MFSTKVKCIRITRMNKQMPVILIMQIHTVGYHTTFTFLSVLKMYLKMLRICSELLDVLFDKIHLEKQML